jgi:hypothetical protein
MGKPTFDLVASFYPLLEQTVFGSTLSRARSFFISRVTEGNNILLIGEGWISARLMSRKHRNDPPGTPAKTLSRYSDGLHREKRS